MPAIRTALAVVALICLAACSGTGSLPSAAPGATSLVEATSSPEAPATASAEPEPTHIAAATAATVAIPSSSLTVDLGGETNGVAVCAGSVWVAVGAPRDEIVRIDPETGDVVGSIKDGSNLTCLDGEPWAAVGEHEIRHVDPETMETVASVPVNTWYVGVGAGSVWAPSGPTSSGSTRKRPRSWRRSRFMSGWTLPKLTATTTRCGPQSSWPTWSIASIQRRTRWSPRSPPATMRTASWSSRKRSGSAMPTKRRSRGSTRRPMRPCSWTGQDRGSGWARGADPSGRLRATEETSFDRPDDQPGGAAGARRWLALRHRCHGYHAVGIRRTRVRVRDPVQRAR